MTKPERPLDFRHMACLPAIFRMKGKMNSFKVRGSVIEALALLPRSSEPDLEWLSDTIGIINGCKFFPRISLKDVLSYVPTSKDSLPPDDHNAAPKKCEVEREVEVNSKKIKVSFYFDANYSLRFKIVSKGKSKNYLIQANGDRFFVPSAPNPIKKAVLRLGLSAILSELRGDVPEH